MFDIDKVRSQIEERNRIRSEAQPPSVSVASELRRLYEHQRRIETHHRRKRGRRHHRRSDILEHQPEKKIRRARSKPGREAA